MKLHQIITSLLENDLYKFSMGQVIFHQFSDYETQWTFKCRNEGIHFTPEMVEEIKEQVKAFCKLRFTDEELDYLASIKWIKKSYIDFLRLWQPRFEDFEISNFGDCGLSIETNGSWLNTSMYEVPTLAIVNEVYFRMSRSESEFDNLLELFNNKLCEKISWLLGWGSKSYSISSFSEFGMRRRLCGEAQELAVEKLSQHEYKGSKCVGTSNVALAKKYNLTPCGTQAHEFIMCVGQGNRKHNPAYSNWYSMDAWIKEYSVLNGTALTDTITTDCFLKDFGLTYATLFSGVRHDSGDPFEWGEKIWHHYTNLGIGSSNKTLLFSDSLDFERADKLTRYFSCRFKVAFGIGTYISNETGDVENGGVKPLNIVMKVTKCNGQDVAKLSDVQGKGMCKNQEYVEYLQRTIDWRMKNS